MRLADKKSKLIILSILLLPATVVAGTREDIETLQTGQAELMQRLERIETLLQNQGLVELMQQLQSLQAELQELRGDVEKHTNDLERMQKRQQDLYLDLETRLNDLQLQSNVPPPPGGTTAGAGVPAVAATPAQGDQEKVEYQNAFELIREARHAEAIQAYTRFLQQYPDGKLAPNAQYWLGEAYFLSKDMEKALVEFGKVIELYPSSSKIPDAKVKIGYTYYELKKWAKARDILTGVMVSYPNTSFALLAEKRLNRMTQEGH
jgi:tol-pal system protein YbgF